VNTVAPVLETRGLVAGYVAVDILHGVDLTVEPGEIVTISSGCTARSTPWRMSTSAK